MSAETRRDISKLNSFIRSDAVDRKVLSAIQTQLDIRIFKQGRDSNEEELGEYSPSYQRLRAERGIIQTVKVNLQFTGQMRKDFKLKVIGRNRYGSGFDNIENYNKSGWVEDRANREIFDLSESEIELLERLYEEEIERRLN